jgi:glycosyltransferase involved in cell wall biosynthesis
MLTAALIARDEERHLPRCLASIAELVDEIVVVDTGSRDGTIDVARSFGAVVVEAEWTDDFAAARNLALGLATGRWILSIDADEWLAPTARDALHALLDEPFAAYRVLLRPAPGHTPYRECRLFRNLPSARFEGRIHERVLPSLAGLPVGACDLLIEHTGYVGTREAKARRDLPLLEAHLASGADDLDQWRRLADAAAASGDLAHARDAYDRAIHLARAETSPAASLTFSGLASLLFAAGEDVDELLAEGRERFPDNHLLTSLHARIEASRGNDDDALASYARLAAVDLDALPDGGISYDERLFDAVAHGGAAGCLFRLGRYEESAAAYERAAAAAPDDLELRAKGALASARARDAVAA